MNSGDTQTIAAAFIIGRGSNNFQSVCEVLSSSDLLKQAYYNGLCTSVNGLQTISGNVPIKYELYQNYPNPFNPTTQISFSLDHQSMVNLRLFDVLGREIKILTSGKYQSGMHTITLDASMLPSGIYFYQLQTGNFTATRKLTLLK